MTDPALGGESELLAGLFLDKFGWWEISPEAKSILASDESIIGDCRIELFGVMNARRKLVTKVFYDIPIRFWFYYHLFSSIIEITRLIRLMKLENDLEIIEDGLIGLRAG